MLAVSASGSCAAMLAARASGSCAAMLAASASGSCAAMLAASASGSCAAMLAASASGSCAAMLAASASGSCAVISAAGPLGSETIRSSADSLGRLPLTGHFLQKLHLSVRGLFPVQTHGRDHLPVSQSLPDSSRHGPKNAGTVQKAHLHLVGMHIHVHLGDVL